MKSPMNVSEVLLDMEQIRALKARYFRFVDTKKWSDLRALFTDDATVLFIEGFDTPKPIEEGMTFITGVFDNAVVTIHNGHMPEIEILDADNARAIWQMQDHLYWPSTRDNPLGISELHGAGHYHETYRRENGEWRIATLKLTRLRRAVIPVATAHS
ncbi:MAG TPA: nuclear transport factor 2 family protein [Steroidobacteraceae bacterium]|jgi:hypothetical protein